MVITTLAASDHRIVVVERSPFEQKFFNLCRVNNDVAVQGIARAYMKDLRWNRDRCIILKPEETAPIPERLASATNPDDHYLLHAQLSVQGAILATTDQDLCRAVKQANLDCLSRTEFLQALK